jgi:hypothetical protein
MQFSHGLPCSLLPQRSTPRAFRGRTSHVEMRVSEVVTVTVDGFGLINAKLTYLDCQVAQQQP